MSKLRSVSTAFWSDPFIEDLTPSEKLLFLYFITNDKTNMLGIYEVSIKKISFDTGINKDIVEKALKSFETLSKVKYINNHIVLVNFMKHQNYNTNMKKSAIDVYNCLPKELKDNELMISKDNPLEGFESLLNHFGMVRKVEVESKLESKIETEEVLGYSPNLPTLNFSKEVKFLNDKEKFKDEVRLFADTYDKNTLNNFFEYWTEPNKTKTKMLWEMQKTFDVGMRLSRWSKNDFGNNKKNKEESFDKLLELTNSIRNQ